MLGRSVGLTKEKVEQLRNWKDSSVYNDEEKLILEYTEELVTNVRISDELYKRVADHFSTQQIINICFTSGISGIINRIHGTFQTDVDESTSSNEFVEASRGVLEEK
ncbi:carboxymuconolactone decarboxylase family protein [Mesobacillus harenae]|uniref:carboxymuconolactone decarboxylase family protein n=1 Tax=Mesobacillus harenae TaxID=2213203 RepID=UPI0015807581|nr:carboxymuconolactone decarboxylase family protein [Mesobacillus harenae]